MRVVLTNDDGFDSPGIEALRSALGERHEVWIMAPDRNRSGVSCALTLDSSMLVWKKSERVFACSGTPVDCVNIALAGQVTPRPDVVVSGINLGANLGTDLFYSGTAGAARQAAWKGCPAVAASLFTYGTPHGFVAAASFMADRLGDLVEDWDGGFYYNLNFPDADTFRSIEDCAPARISYAGGLVPLTAVSDRYEFKYRGAIAEAEPEPGSDLAAVLAGSVSITRIALVPSVYRMSLEACLP